MTFCKSGSRFLQRPSFVRATVILNLCTFSYVAYHEIQRGSINISYLPYSSSENEILPGPNADQQAPDTTERDGLETVSITTDQSVTITPTQDEYFIPCKNKDPSFSYSQRGTFWVLNNYIGADRYFECDESITYATHGDFTFLDNIVPLLKRWEGPLSMALYTPGSDYMLALQSIDYLRKCTDPAVKERVTFHLVLDSQHLPQPIFPLHANQGTDPSLNTGNQTYPETNCSQSAPWELLPKNHVSYKSANNLTYPINVLRNVAIRNSQTHYVLLADAELYPSPSLVTEFMKMLRRNESVLNLGRPRIFILPIFEVYENQTVPESKSELVSKLKSGLAIPFHKMMCSACHSIPKIAEWTADNTTEGLRVFHVAKRHKPYQNWEPIHIGSQDDPPYDERLTWEGKSDKMTQSYALCTLDYDFMILDNAFLVHRPGIKLYKDDPARNVLSGRQSALIRNTIFKELKLMYGSRPECAL